MEKKHNIFVNSIKQNRFYTFSPKSWLFLIMWIAIASAICYILCTRTKTKVSVEMIFILAIFLTSLTTESYFYGILASIISVLMVNWAFTYPYLKINFSISGYLLTSLVMLTVGITTSTLTTMIRSQEEMRIKAEKAQVTSTLLRSISHDIRTPLTAIIGDLEMISGAEALKHDPVAKNTASDAISNAMWLRRMIENVLSITRVGNDANEIVKTAEIPEEIIADVISKFKKNYPDILIKASIPDEIFAVPADAILTEQLLLNLMENAAQHGKATEISLSCTKDENYAVFSVKDNGCGIKEEYKNHLFDGSMMLMQNDKNKYMGLGLMVCKTIVDAHGGTICAKSSDKGSEFIFTMRLNYGEK